MELAENIDALELKTANGNSSCVSHNSDMRLQSIWLLISSLHKDD